MADVDYDDFDTGHPSGWSGQRMASGRLTQITHLAGALCSVALVLGLGMWGYKLAVRDVNGVPVVRAMGGPMRIAPENPGGEVADHQGLAVNTIAALGTAAPPPDRLVLAPRPLELTPEDNAGLAPIDPNATVETAPVVSETALSADPVPADVLGPDPDAVAQALAEALAEPLAEPLADAQTDDGSSLAANEPIRPRARPTMTGASSDLSVAVTDTETVAATGMGEVDPATIPSGTRLVQLGAFDTPEQARSEWAKLANQFGPVMLDKALVVQAAESGGRTFYRLRAHGFADEVAARGFCTTLLEQNASCIPVEQR
jgi:hypothetical protein